MEWIMSKFMVHINHWRNVSIHKLPEMNNVFDYYNQSRREGWFNWHLHNMDKSTTILCDMLQGFFLLPIMSNCTRTSIIAWETTNNEKINLKNKLRDNNSHVSSTAPCLLVIQVLSRNAAPSLCEGGDARFGNQGNIVKRGYFVRDVEVKNKSPVSWSCFPPGSRLSAFCFLLWLSLTKKVE